MKYFTNWIDMIWFNLWIELNIWFAGWLGFYLHGWTRTACCILLRNTVSVSNEIILMRNKFNSVE